MKVHIQQRRASRSGTALERRLDVGQVVQTLASEQIYNEVRTREPHTVPLYEVILTVIVGDGRSVNKVFLLGGA